MPLERLQKYGNRNYFRVTVPKDLRAVFGKREVKVSLKTSDLEEAKKRVRQLSAEFDAILQSPTQLTDLTPEQIRDMVRAWRDEGMDGVNHSIIPDDPTDVARRIEYCRYAVTRGTFPLTSQLWEEGDVNEQESTRDPTQVAHTSIR